MRRPLPALALLLLAAGTVPIWIPVPSPAWAKRARSFDRDAFRDGYRAALDHWASGAGEAAVAELASVEMAAIAEDERDAAMEALRRAEIAAIRGVLDAGYEVLMPIALLHEQTYLHHLRARQVPLAQHSRQLVFDLVEMYAARVPGSSARELASGLLTSLAGHLQEARADRTAQQLYERALEIDHDNTTAYLALAVLHERRSDYRSALPHLRRLLEIEPRHAEARLREAIQLLRVGRREEGTAGLRDLLASGGTGWVRSLAYQELARLLMEDGDWFGARRLLEDAVAELPDDPTLPIQLAYVSERYGVPSTESALAGGLRRSSERRRISPRFQYIQIPYGPLEDLRRRVRSRSESSRVALAEALAPKTRPAGAGP